MPAYFEQGFFVRVPAWHGLGVVLDDYPGREEAMRLAGHDFDVVEVPVALVGRQLEDGQESPRVLTDQDGTRRSYKPAGGWKGHVRSDNGELLHVSKESFQRIPNSVPYDFAEELLDQGFQYETGITLKGGAVCALTLLLDEPYYVTGDPSKLIPYLGLSWAHDGSASLKGRGTTVRQVCANTVSMSEAEGKALGTDFTIRHTKNWKDRVEDAKKLMRGVREGIEVYREFAEELASIPVTPEQRDLFVSTIIGDKDGVVSKSATVSERVKSNIETERAKVNAAFMSETIPEAHMLTGYGLHMAGVEYFDHLRNARSKDSYVTRTLLSDNPAKANLARTIRELVAA